ncbi:MAG: InlB B-repeat-containing protein, partial [Oscillospiraceae bacterium]|nr:InlB B-repeat-containing protein [Oscillospiraceae bacterium]
DVTGLTLEVSKSDGSTETADVTASMVSGFDSSKLGKQILTVTYEGFTDTYEVEVKATVTPPVTVTGITLNSDSAKKIYTEGDTLDVTGLTLEVSKSDGSTETVDVTASMVSGFDSSRIGKQTLTVSYKGFTDTYEVEVKANIAPTYTVIFDPNGGSVTPTSGTTGTDGKLASLPTPNRANHTFDGWFTEKSGGTRVDEHYVFSGNVTIYAHWTYTGGGGGGITTQYTLTYETNGGNAVAATKHSRGTTVNLTATPTREGYTFDGWYSDAALTNNITSIMMDGNKTVYAGWKENGSVTPSHDCPSAHLKDVDINAWYHEYVDYVVEKVLMQGVSDDLFAPNVTTSRAMIVTILHRLEGRPAASGKTSFDDVVAGSWYADAVAWAEENDIVNGYGGGKFGPNDLITREQFAAIMYRYANFKGYDTSVGQDTNILSYDDAFDVAEWAIEAMQWACGAGLIKGRTEALIVPKGNATRAEVAAVLMRFIENVK